MVKQNKSTGKRFDLARDLVYIDDMAVTYNIHDAKTHFSKLIARVNGGEEIIIARAGEPVAKLVPVNAGISERKPGTASGKIHITKDFSKPLPDSLLKDFEK